MQALIAIIKNYILLEYRSWTQGLGLIVLVWIIAFLVYRLQPEMSIDQLNLIFWLFILLVAVNASMRQEAYYTPEERLNLYTLVDPVTLILARILFNFIYLLFISFLFYLFIIMYYAPAITFQWENCVVMILGSFAISTCLAIVTAIGTQGGGQNTLVSILGFPLMIPVIILLNNINKTIIMSGSAPNSRYLLILGISAIGLSLSIVLFPFIWKQ